jgi:hypothetical protein
LIIVVLFWVMLNVPPPVAEKPATAPFKEIPPVKFIVAPVLDERFIPVLLLVPFTAPENATVPPVVFAILIALLAAD